MSKNTMKNEEIKKTPKKKGRPKSNYYVSEQELRDEIEKSQKKAKKILDEIEDIFEQKINNATDTIEKEKILREKEETIKKAKQKSYCTNKLGEIILLTVDRIATQSKFRHYSYLEDMKAEAIFQSVRGIIKFNLNKKNAMGQNSSSFSYLTQIITNAFRQVLKNEKKNREIKDQAIEMAVNQHVDTNLEFDSVRRLKEKNEGKN
jgi:predicted NBD/HSP70 family sugar kinase